MATSVFEIAGQVAFVTGGNRGIGRAFVRALLERGAKKVYATARNAEALDEMKREGGDRVVPVQMDVRDEASVARAAERATDVTVLINNAGIATGERLLGAATLQAARDEMEVNYFGPLIVTRAFAPILEENHGAIVNVLSILSRVNAPAAGSYSASKAAALSATEGIRAELAPFGVRVVSVMPGYVDTEMVERLAVPKMAASDVVDAALGALRTGVEDVYPGVAANIAELLTTNPAIVHAQFAAGLTAPH